MLAIMLARRGYAIQLYEKRPDLRDELIDGGRSINLALSTRGLRALDLVGLKKKALELAIPMHGRGIHDEIGNTWMSPYSGRQEDYINSISRTHLNALLLDELEQFDNVKTFFEHKCITVNHLNTTIQFQKEDGSIIHNSPELIFATDGAGSIIRRTLEPLEDADIEVDTQFLETGYKELSIPPTIDGGWRIQKNALHIWPRNSFMLIALPNLDGSFTVTCFFPFEGENSFESLKSEDDIEKFFIENFPDVVEHMPNLLEDYMTNPVGNLGTVKCNNWSVNNIILLGDAAHAIVPFYGQGMNASFEDVSILYEFLEKHEDDWQLTAKEFGQFRKKDADAIADLALDNYYEMQDHVIDPIFIKKRKAEMLLEEKYSDYNSKYSMVTFCDDIRYSTAIKEGRMQDSMLKELLSKAKYDLETLEDSIDEIYQYIKIDSKRK